MTPGNQTPADLPSEVQEEDISSADAAERLERDPEEQENREDVPDDNRLRQENARADDD
jgi:hypothetical protein